jgi:cytochrome c oxidase subunit 4
MSDQPTHAHGPVVETHDGSGGHNLAGHDPHSGHPGHSAGIAQYIYVFIALCILTTISFMTSFDWWRANFTPVESRMLMMAVSCMKASLVILFFMHVLWEANWKFVLTIPAMLMSIFLILMLVPDIGMRLHHASEEQKFHLAQPKPDVPAPRSAEHPSTEPLP